MTSDLSVHWLRKLHEYISRTANRKSILLIDNCSGSGSVLNISDLLNVKVVLLPSNTASQIQPLDAGSIACMKLRYLSFQMDRALYLLDENVCTIYKVDVLSATLTVKPKWRELEPTKKSNCWNHTGIKTEQSIGDISVLRAEKEKAQNLVDRLVRYRSRMLTTSLSNMPAEKKHSQIVMLKDLVDGIVHEESIKSEDDE